MNIKRDEYHILRKTDELVVAAGKQTFLETPGVKQCFLG